MDLITELSGARQELAVHTDAATLWRAFDLAWHATSCAGQLSAGIGAGWLVITTALIDVRDALDELAERPSPAAFPARCAQDSPELRAETVQLLRALRRAVLAYRSEITPGLALARVRAGEALNEAASAWS